MNRAQDYLPTLELARAAEVPIEARVWWRLGGEIDLLEREPTDVQRVAAIVVDARSLKRSVRDEVIEVSEGRAAAIPEPTPPPPDEFVSAEHVLLVERAGRVQPCTSCHVGQVVCGICGGEGWVAVYRNNQSTRAACPRCKQSGYLPCPTCAGSGRTIPVRSRHVSDVAAHLRYPYVPDMPFALEESLTGFFEQEAREATPPKCLRVDLSPKKTGGPYRQHLADPTEFHGYRFENTLDQARRAIAGLAGTGAPLKEEVSCWARPILWLSYRAFGVRREVGLFVQLDGALRAVVTDGGV